MINRIGKWFDYLSYLFNSTNRHGVHSPFVYEFVDKVLYQEFPSRNEFLEYHRTLMLQSKSGGFENQSLSNYVDSVVLPSKHCELLQRIFIYYNINHIVDIGPSTGLEYNYLRFVIDSNQNSFAKFHYFSKSGKFLSLFEKSMAEYDKVIGPNQTYPAEFILDDENVVLDNIKTMYLFNRLDLEIEFWSDFDKLLPKINNHDLIIFNSIYHNESAKLNWQRIINNPEFHVTIDCFNLGIAMKRQEQEKEHFQLRY